MLLFEGNKQPWLALTADGTVATSFLGKKKEDLKENVFLKSSMGFAQNSPLVLVSQAEVKERLVVPLMSFCFILELHLSCYGWILLQIPSILYFSCIFKAHPRILQHKDIFTLPFIADPLLHSFILLQGKFFGSVSESLLEEKPEEAAVKAVCPYIPEQALRLAACPETSVNQLVWCRGQLCIGLLML